jgi:hypothetical protein
MMETVGIPHNNFSCNNLGDELDGRVAVTTHSKVLDNPNRVPGGVLISPNAIANFSLWCKENMFLLLLLHIIQYKVCVRHIPCLLHLPRQSLQLCINFAVCGCDLSPTRKVYLLFDLNPTASRLLFHPLSFIIFLTFSMSSHLPAAA